VIADICKKLVNFAICHVHLLNVQEFSLLLLLVEIFARSPGREAAGAGRDRAGIAIEPRDRDTYEAVRNSRFSHQN
jgi:hypothetical protein